MSRAISREETFKLIFEYCMNGEVNELTLEEVLKIEKEKRESIEDMTKTVDKVMETVKDKTRDFKKNVDKKRKLKEDKDEKI